MLVTYSSLVGFLTAPLAAVLALRALDDEGLSRPDRCRRCGRRFAVSSLLTGIARKPESAVSEQPADGSAVAPETAGRCCCGASPPRWIPLVSVMTALLFGFLAWAMLGYNSQHVDEVQPSDAMRIGRLGYHLVLIWLLLIITITDLLDYIVDLRITSAGLVIGIAGATVSGHFQLIHYWVNWDHLYLAIEGPYLPAWMDEHRHLHGLVWSVLGAVCGASVTWIVRSLSQLILRQPALGMGDVHIMAMVGSFIGWQPTLCVLAISPLAGIVTWPVCRFVLNRRFVAFGPYLAVSTIVVLFTWRFLWEVASLRIIFSHLPTVAALVLGSIVLLAVLLVGLRFWKRIGTSAR